MKAVEWTLITVTYYSAEALEHFFTRPLPDGVEWLVVDNASHDDSAATARSLGVQVTVLPRNRGFAAANNVALHAAGGRHIAFFNPHVNRIFAEPDEALHLVGYGRRRHRPAQHPLDPRGLG